MENNPESRMLDYTVLCFLVGNDFLPNLPSIRIREESLSDLIVAYKAISWELDAYLVTQTGHINREFLQRLFDYIAETEDTVLVEQTQNRHARIAKQQYRKKRLSAYELEKDTYENVESQWVDQIEAGTPGWRNRYYQYHIGCITMIRPMVENYIAGLEWVLNYYTGHSNQNWSWYYKYPVAPTAADLADLLRFVPEIRHTPSPPVSPVVQLMHILPPDSAALIRDERMRRLMTEKSSPIIWYYPTSFKIDMQGARYRHEAKCILPKGDLSVLNNSNII
jgi:5'-3' exonuclease